MAQDRLAERVEQSIQDYMNCLLHGMYYGFPLKLMTDIRDRLEDQ